AVRGIRRRRWPPVYLERAFGEIRDPVLGQARPRVEAALEAAVQRQARIRDLDDEGRGRRMRADIVMGSPGDDGDVGLRLRVVVEGKRRMEAWMPPGAEGRREHLGDQGTDR